MIVTWVLDVLSFTNWDSWVDKVLIRVNESRPFAIFGHGNRSFAQLVHGCICSIGLTLQDPRQRIVGLLNLADNNCFQLATRCLEIEICLEKG